MTITTKVQVGGTLVLAGLLAVATSSVATASTGPLIPPGSTGSLTVHKYEQPVTYGSNNQGMELPQAQTEGLDPLPGVTFSVQQVEGVNLTTNTGWQKAQRVVEGFNAFEPTASLSGHTLGPASTAVTHQDGTAKFSDLPVGLYLVRESAVPLVQENQVITPAMPFLITVPLTDPTDRHHWVYDVHAYPKNAVSTIEKSVDDGDTVGLGEQIEYTIETTIPGGSVTEKYVVTDHLDPKLTYVDAAVEIGGAPTADFEAVHESGTLTVALGHKARQDAFDSLMVDPDAKVAITVTATVNSAGEIDNDATLTFNRADELETEVTSVPVATKFGGIQVRKTSQDGTPLAGAVFEVWASHTGNFEDAAKTKINGVHAWASSESGLLEIDGLRYSAWANGSAVQEDSGHFLHYWLVETKAPVGYELLAEPVPFLVESQLASSVEIEVLNVPHNAGGQLPLTGSSGLAGLVAAGLLATGGGVYGLRRMSRMAESAPDRNDRK